MPPRNTAHIELQYGLSQPPRRAVSQAATAQPANRLDINRLAAAGIAISD